MAETITDIEAERIRRKIELALSYRIFASHRWGELGDGHISARDPEHADCIWLVRYGVPFDDVTVDDLVLVEPGGTVVEGEGSVNRAACYIHHPIHAARPDIIAAAHTHTQWGTPFSAMQQLFRPIIQESCLFFENHVLFDDEEVDIMNFEGGKRIAAALEGNLACILANHGLLTVGASVAECVGAFVTMERVAETHMKAPEAIAISDGAARTARDHMMTSPLFEVTFDYLLGRHAPDASAVT